MKINDELYGQYQLEEVLIELIQTEPIQRLKNIHQAGAAFLANQEWNVTRYEHSVGVMLLIKRLGGSIEEQIAGLLHDVSHTVFSHAVDVAFDIREQNYHEMLIGKVILNSDIPTILAKYQIRLSDIFDNNRWSILEQPLPKLCADRLDYTLRDMYRYFDISKQEINLFLQSLVVVDGEICVTTVEMAEWFTTIYYQLVIDYFLSPINIYSYDILAKMINLSLRKGILNRDQLLLDDPTVMNIIKASHDHDILRLFNLLSSEIELEENDQDYDIHLVGKSRIIDISVSSDGIGKQSASLHSARIREMNDSAKATFDKGKYIKVTNHLTPTY